MKLFTIMGSIASLLLIGCAVGMGGSSGQVQDSDGNVYQKKNGFIGPMKTAVNGSFCPENLDENCSRYGALYTLSAARRVCESVGATLPKIRENRDYSVYKDEMSWKLGSFAYGAVNSDYKIIVGYIYSDYKTLTHNAPIVVNAGSSINGKLLWTQQGAVKINDITGANVDKYHGGNFSIEYLKSPDYSGRQIVLSTYCQVN